MTLLPYLAALGSAIEEASPKVREHFVQPSGIRRYRGVMRRVWRRAGWRGRVALISLRIGTWTDAVFAETGMNVPFELENIVNHLFDGRATMTWSRIFHFPQGTKRFHALMVFDPERGVLVDWLGESGHLEVELHPQVQDRAIVVRSGRQWLLFGPIRVPIPRLISGHARIHEWQQEDGSLGICVTLWNPLLGEFFGYEGSFFKVPGCMDKGDDLRTLYDTAELR